LIFDKKAFLLADNALFVFCLLAVDEHLTFAFSAQKITSSMEKSWNFPTRSSLFCFKNGNLKTGTFFDEIIISQRVVFEHAFLETFAK